MTHALVPVQRIEPLIRFVRCQKVMLDSDLAELFGVSTRRLNEQVRRNPGRFPADFAFRVTAKEYHCLMSQFATSNGRGGRRKLPLVFTEHGAIMAANVLNSQRAIAASVWVVRAFIKLREALAANRELAHKLAELERKLETRLDKHDDAIQQLFEAIRQLMAPPEEPPKGRIGFHRESETKGKASGRARR